MARLSEKLSVRFDVTTDQQILNEVQRAENFNFDEMNEGEKGGGQLSDFRSTHAQLLVPTSPSTKIKPI